MPTVQVRFAPPLHERFVQECDRRDINPSEFIRRAVEAMMDHIDTPKETTRAAHVPMRTSEEPREHSDPKRRKNALPSVQTDNGPCVADREQTAQLGKVAGTASEERSSLSGASAGKGVRGFFRDGSGPLLTTRADRLKVKKP